MKRILIIFLFFLSVGFILFHKQILLFGICKYSVAYLKSKNTEISFDFLDVKRNKVIFSKVFLTTKKKEIVGLIPKGEMRFHLHLKKPFISVDFHLKDPYVEINELSYQKHLFGLFTANDLVSVHVFTENGQIDLHQNDTVRKIKLKISKNQKVTFVNLQIGQDERLKIASQANSLKIDAQNWDLGLFFKILPKYFDNQNVQGKVDLDLSVALKEKIEIFGRACGSFLYQSGFYNVEIPNASFICEKLAIPRKRKENIWNDFSKFLGSISFQDAKMSYKDQIQIKHLEGKCTFKENSSIALNGLINDQPFSIGSIASSAFDENGICIHIDQKKVLKFQGDDAKGKSYLLSLSNFQGKLLNPIIDHWFEKEGIIFKDGMLSADIKITLEKTKKNLKIEKGVFTDLELDIGPAHVKAEHIQYFGSINLMPGDWKNSLCLDSKIKNAIINMGKETVHIPSADIFASNGNFYNSLATIAYNELIVDSELKGTFYNFNILSKVRGKFLRNDIFGNVAIQKRKNIAQISGNLAFKDEEEILFALDVEDFDFLAKGGANNFLNSVRDGWIRADKLSLEYFSNFFKDFSSFGQVSFTANLKRNFLNILLKGRGVSFKTKNFEVKLNEIGNMNKGFFAEDESVKFTYNGALSGSLDRLKGSIFNSDMGMLEFDLGKIQINGSKLFFEAYNGINGLAFFSNGFYSFADRRGAVFLKKIEGEINSQEPIFKNFCSFDRSDYSCSVKGEAQLNFAIEDVLKFQLAAMTARIEELDIDNQKLHVRRAEFLLDIANDRVNIFHAKAALLNEQNEILITAPFIAKEGANGSFDIRIQKNLLELLRFYGSFSKENQNYQIRLDEEKSFIFGKNIKLCRAEIDQNFKFSSVDLKAKLPLADLIKHFNLVEKFFPVIKASYLQENSTKGEIDFSLLLLNDRIDIDASSSSIGWNDKNFHKFDAKVIYKENIFEVEHFILDDTVAKLSFYEQQDTILFEDIFIKQKDAFFIKMSGMFQKCKQFFDFKIEEARVDLKKQTVVALKNNLALSGVLMGKGILNFSLTEKEIWQNCFLDMAFDPFDLQINSYKFSFTAPMHVRNLNNQAITIENINFRYINANSENLFTVKKVLFDSAFWQFDEIEFNFHNIEEAAKSVPEKFHKYLRLIQFPENGRLIFNLKADQHLNNWELYFPKLDFLLINKEQNVENLFIRLDEKQLAFEFNLDILGKKVFVANELQICEPMRGKTFLVEDKKNSCPLAIDWSFAKSVRVNKVQGKLSGFEISMNAVNGKELELIGNAKFDFKEVRHLLPLNMRQILEKLKIGSGFAMKGTIHYSNIDNSYYFKGLFSGENFELLRYKFKTLLTQVEIAPDKILLQDFKISDNCGFLTIDKILFEKKANEWQMSIPFIEITDFRPSLMQQIGVEAKEMEPFMIKDLRVFDFQGNINDRNSFSGMGSFNFINSFKRGYSVFEFPSEVLSRIVGLDAELLTPVKGKVEMQVKEGRFYLTKLKDVYSEKKRSKFYFLDEIPSYIDFDGKVNINMGMKQYVLFKLTESFIITIQGDLDDPKYNLRKKKWLLN